MPELLRYGIVGGISFLADFLLLYILRETVCSGSMAGLYLAAVGGFLGGILVNTCLSVRFVFRAPSVVQKRRGRNLRDLLVIICIIESILSYFINIDIIIKSSKRCCKTIHV